MVKRKDVCPCCGKPLVRVDEEGLMKEVEHAVKQGFFKRYKGGFLVKTSKGIIWIRDEGQVVVS